MFFNSGKGKKKTYHDELDFTAPLAASSAENLGNFHITQKITRKKTAKVKVLAAVYSASNNSITLTISQPARQACR